VPLVPEPLEPEPLESSEVGGEVEASTGSPEGPGPSPELVVVVLAVVVVAVVGGVLTAAGVPRPGPEWSSLLGSSVRAVPVGPGPLESGCGSGLSVATLGPDLLCTGAGAGPGPDDEPSVATLATGSLPGPELLTTDGP
jgi:hypothetical protein